MTPPHLPASMEPFVSAIGASPTLSIIRVFGGGRLYVPQLAGLSDAHPLVSLLGRPLAEKLAAAIGGEHHDVVTATALEAALRNAEIRRRFRAGASVRELALAFGVSKRMVWHVLRGAQDFTPDKQCG
ncbi:MAG: hypothetical protein IT518_25055 [Burkholderiales bacterium]|nr:hypothetical protein [Burkholderiales bacterium]